MKNFRLITFVAVSIFFVILVTYSPARGQKKKERYYIDYNESDQGVYGEGNSLKALLDKIDLSIESAIIFSHHPANGEKTIYTLGTNISIPYNIILEFQKGALLNIDTNVTIEINSPENICALPKQHIKTGKGKIFFIQAGIVHPGWWGTPLDGYTDSSSYWKMIIDAVQPESTIELLPNACYYINTSGGVTFSKKVYIKGHEARFICGPWIENNPAITLIAPESIIEDFEVDCSSNHFDFTGDNDFQDTDDNFSNNLRSAIEIRGDNTISRYLDIKTAVVGICYKGVTGGEIHNCCITNSKIKSNTSDANNYNAGIRICDSRDIIIYGNYVDGYGQNIIIGGSHKIEKIKIHSNKLLNASNNGIYISSGTEMEIWDNDVISFDCTGIKVRDSYHNIHHNRIYCDVTAGSISGINITGNGYDDGDGFNGRDTIVNANIISGSATAGIMSSIHDNMNLKNPHIINNVINFDPAPVKPAYGIFIKGLSNGSIISGNMAVGGHSFGLLMNGDSDHFHDNSLITDNCFIGGTNDAFAIVNLRNSFISNNQGKNCGYNRSGLMLYNSVFNKCFNNDFGDDHVQPTQKYGIEEQGSSDYNEYINNCVTGVNNAGYFGLGVHSTIIDMDDNLTIPHVDKIYCNPFPGQGILPNSISVPVDSSIFIRLKDGKDIDENSIIMTVNGLKVDPFFKQIDQHNGDYWIIHNPAKSFNFEQIVNITIKASNIFESILSSCEYSFRVESEAEYILELKNTPPFIMDESDQIKYKIIADSGSEIRGAKIIYDPYEPVKPRFGSFAGLPDICKVNAVAVGCPLSLEPPTVFNNPVTILVPCPGINDLSNVKIFFYNPVIGWMPASEVVGLMLNNSIVYNPETDPPTIEIRINYSGVFQAGIPSNPKGLLKIENYNSIDVDENGIETNERSGGCFFKVFDR
ncbi:MAG: hypothetical protein ACMUHX_05560 [bacterium]